MQKTSKRVLAFVLALVMTVSLFSISASAYNAGYESETHTVFKHTVQTLAPGVEYYNNYAYLNDGEQVVYYTAVADINRDDVIVQGSYWNTQTEQYGMAKLTEQVASANAKFSNPDDPDFISENYTVVAGTNGDFYNMQNGRPSGAFAINGHVMNTANNRAWFAIFKDGTALCGYNNADYNAAIEAHGAVQNSVGGSAVLVYDGKDVSAAIGGDYNTTRASRTMIGVTADNKVVSVVVDGRQSPFSDGGTMTELANIMLEAECVMAINLDGGGSTTFVARPEGEDSVKVINRPSDGSERSISSGVVIASLATPSNIFDRVSITPADDYVTPYAAVAFDVTGISTSGASAEIPADIVYSATLGSVVDGQFISDGTAGDAVITATYNNETVGTAVVHVVIPDSIAFAQETFTVPYDKSMDLAIVAKYGLNYVVTKPADFTYTLKTAEGAGEIVDGAMVAPSEGSGAEGNVVTATLKYDTTKSISANIAFGKASVVIFDFEDGTTQNWVRYNTSNYNYIRTRGTTANVTAEDGQVHSGDHALKISAKFSETWEAGYVSGRAGVYGLSEIIDLKGATRIGMWMYIPVANASFNGRLFMCKVSERDEETGKITKYEGYYTATLIDQGGDWNCGFVTQYDEPGWHYVYFDLSTDTDWCIINNHTLIDFYINDRNGDKYGYNHLNYTNGNADMNIYIDDVTVDYSSVIEDRDAPVFTEVKLGDEGNYSNEGLVLERGSNYVSDGYSRIDLSARVADYASSNATGLNAASAKVYLDGVEFPCTFANGIIAAPTKVYTNGKHTVKFTIEDNNGNYASAIRTFTVANTEIDQPVWIEAKNPDADKILLGSLYWVNVKAEDASAISSVDVDLDLDNLSNWELDHMEIAQGFDASYTIVNADENIACLTITRNSDDIALLDGGAIVSMPIRTWELPAVAADYGHAGVVWMYNKYKAGNEVWPVSVFVNVAAGQVTFTDNSSEIFTGDEVKVRTESIYWDNDNAKASDPYYTSWNGGHDHRPETAEYYAAGTTNHTTDEDIVYVDGFEPVDATCTEDGFSGRTFCTVCNSVVDWGHVIPATGHDWILDQENHTIICKTCGELASDYTGLFEWEGVYYYAKFGHLASGWVMIEDDWYYFMPDTYQALTGTSGRFFAGVNYVFDNTGKLTDGVWYNDGKGTRYYYGPGYPQSKWYDVDGKTYYFDAGGYRYEGVRYVVESNAKIPTWYDFGEDGAMVGKYTTEGLYDYNGNTYYINADGTGAIGIVEVDGKYYYFKSSTFAAVKGQPYWASVTNDLLPAAFYDFGEDGAIIFPEPVEPKNGIVDGFYYVNDVKTYGGLIEIDGDYYYVNSSGKVITLADCNANGQYWVSESNNLLNGSAFYTFGEDGKIILPEAAEPKNGIVDGYYYVNGVKTYAGLIKIGEDYYYVRSTGEIVKNQTYWVTVTNNLLPQTFYTFDEEGKIILPEVVINYYLVGSMNSWTASNNYLFVKNDHSQDNEYMLTGVQIEAGSTLKVISSEGTWYPDNDPDMTINDAGIYDFYFRPNGNGDDAWHYHYIYAHRAGDIPQPKNGIVDGYYYVDDVKTYAGLIEIDGYYYVNSSGKVITSADCNDNGQYWVSRSNNLLNGSAFYTFGEDGKIILPEAAEPKNGIVDGYYYVNGVKTYAGLIKIGEDYYYVRSTGEIVKNQTYWVSKTNDLLPAQYYTFGPDGAMIND